MRELTGSVVGPDYLSMVSGEVKSPRRVMPRAFKTTVYRIFGFYLTGALCIGIVAASDDPALLGAIADKAAGAAKSPYVICEFDPALVIPILPWMTMRLLTAQR